MEETYRDNVTGSEIVDSNMREYATYRTSSVIPHRIDGLKCVQRRILCTLGTNTNLIKCWQLVGNVIAVHPHGDASINDALIRLGQPFKQAIPWIHSEGNLGTYAGSAPAAGRYLDLTSAEVTREVFFNRTNGKTLLTQPSEMSGQPEPVYLIPAIPTAFLMGSYTVSVGFISKIPCHHLGDICDLVKVFIELRQQHPTNYLYQHRIVAPYLIPDFPTHCMIRNYEQLLRQFGAGNWTENIVMDGLIEVYPDHFSLRSLPERVEVKDICYALGKECLQTGTFMANTFTQVLDLDHGYEYANKEFSLRRNYDPFLVLPELKRRLSFTAGYRSCWNFIDDEGHIGEYTPLRLLDVWYDARYRSLAAESGFVMKELTNQLYRYTAMLIIADHAKEVADIFRTADTEIEAEHRLMQDYNLTQYQAHFLSQLNLRTLTHQGVDELVKNVEEVRNKIKTTKEKFQHIDTQICKDAAEIKSKFGNYPRRTVIPKAGYFLGLVQLEHGAIQFTSYAELHWLLSIWKQRVKGVVLYHKHTHLYVSSNDHLEGALQSYQPKELYGSLVLASRGPLLRSLLLTNGMLYSRPDSFLMWSDKAWCAYSTNQQFYCLHKDYRLQRLDSSTLTKRTNLDGQGLKTDFIAATGYQEGPLLAVCQFVSSPQRLLLQRLEEGQRLLVPFKDQLSWLELRPLGESCCLTLPGQSQIRQLLLKQPTDLLGDRNFVTINLRKRQVEETGRTLNPFYKENNAALWTEQNSRKLEKYQH